MFDDQLLKWKFKRGSDEALTLIYEKYLDSMLTLALGLLNDAAAAEDVVQDVFVAFAQSRRISRCGAASAATWPPAWSTACGTTSGNGSGRPWARRGICVSTEPPDPSEAVILTEQAKLLARAVAELPEEQREVVLLRLKADLKFRDIAKLQQTSVNTVLSRYRYGLERLRSRLDGEVEK